MPAKNGCTSSIMYLAIAQHAGQKPEQVMDIALSLAGYKNQDAAKLTREALIRNLDIANMISAAGYGCVWLLTPRALSCSKTERSLYLLLK